jgi:transportin-3
MAQPVQFGPGTTPAKAAEAAFADSLPDLGAPSVTVPLDDARRIILAFYSPSIGADLRRRLDRWLEKYQTRPEAWAMADKFLTADLDATSPTSGAATTAPGGAPTAEQQQLMLFAAITMHHKIRYDFLDLPAESIPSLRDTLLRHIARLVNRAAAAGGGGASGTGPVLSRLCLAFASLVVQTKTTSGEEAVASIVSLFPPGSPGAVALLEILTTVAEEANSRRTPISAARRDAFLGGLRVAAPSVLGLLQSVLHGAATAGQSTVVERVFRCFGAWVGACDLPPALVAECPLFQNVFDALLRYPALFSVACDTIHELLRAYRE